MPIAIASFPDVSLGRWEIAEYITIAFVIIGVIGEFFSEFTNVVKSKEDKHRLGRISTLVLIVALVAELICLVKVNQLSGQIIAVLQKNTADAQKDAAVVRLETEKLKALFSWREISPENREKFAILVKNAPKGGVTIQSLAGNPEAVSFGLQLGQVLKLAGYNVTDDPGRLMAVGVPPVGVEITVKQDTAAQPIFAGPLQRALASINIDAVGKLNDIAGDGVILTIYGKPYSIPTK